jgi:hypothetical protein
MSPHALARANGVRFHDASAKHLGSLRLDRS